VLIRVYDKGIFIIGKPGVGKSRLAYRLLNRGHRFVGDDAVDISLKKKRLIGRAPPAIRGLLWLNGVGLVEVKRHWGKKAILNQQSIDFLLKLEIECQISHLGTETLLGITLPCLWISPTDTQCITQIENAILHQDRSFYQKSIF
jgi:HPr kinase/phosphorylase